MEPIQDPDFDEQSDGYRYNGEYPWLLPPESILPPEPRKEEDRNRVPVARTFRETESFLTAVAPPQKEELFRLPVKPPKPRQPHFNPCHKCKSPRTHRYFEGGVAMRYVCTEHAIEARDAGHDMYGPPLPRKLKAAP